MPQTELKHNGPPRVVTVVSSSSEDPSSFACGEGNDLGTADSRSINQCRHVASMGLAELEFIINRQIDIHPKALLDFTASTGFATRSRLNPSPRGCFVHRGAEGVSTIAAAFAPKPVIVRMSDFKSNEYANLLGGDRYEPMKKIR